MRASVATTVPVTNVNARSDADIGRGLSGLLQQEGAIEGGYSIVRSQRVQKAWGFPFWGGHMRVRRIAIPPETPVSSMEPNNGFQRTGLALRALPGAESGGCFGFDG
jgi:hypothetical protein